MARHRRKKHRRTAKQMRLRRAQKQCRGEGSRTAYRACLRTELGGSAPSFGRKRRRH